MLPCRFLEPSPYPVASYSIDDAKHIKRIGGCEKGFRRLQSGRKVEWTVPAAFAIHRPFERFRFCGMRYPCFCMRSTYCFCRACAPRCW